LKRPWCIHTVVYNEPLWWPIWRRYYSRWFEPQDIYVNHVIKPRRTWFDDHLVGDCWRHGHELIPFYESERLDFALNTSRINTRVRELLERYEQVITCEIDEFLVSPVGLGPYLSAWDGNVGLASGYEVVHHFRPYKRSGVPQDPEPAIAWNKPLLAQRAWWYRSLLYSKPVITTIPITYRDGLHTCVEAESARYTSDLLLLHLSKIDWDLAIERRKARIGQREPTDNHSFFGDELAQWWFTTVDSGTPLPVGYEAIPEWVQLAL